MKLAALLLIIAGCATTPAPIPPQPPIVQVTDAQMFVHCMFGPDHGCNVWCCGPTGCARTVGLAWSDTADLFEYGPVYPQGYCTWSCNIPCDRSYDDYGVCLAWDADGDGDIDLEDWAVLQQKSARFGAGEQW